MPELKRQKICLVCGKEYLGVRKSKYCSCKCSASTKKNGKINTCKTCSKEFYVQKYQFDREFCSKSCYNANGITTINCNNCGKQVQKVKNRVDRTKNKRNFCSFKCFLSFNRKENCALFKPDLRIKGLTIALKQWSQRVKERDDYKCQICGNVSKPFLEAHHIKHRDEYPELQLEIENGITLCVRCHADKHRDDARVYGLINSRVKKFENEQDIYKTFA
jgi:hypothetical protein